PLLGFVNDISVDYAARDTNTYRFGGKYALNDTWSISGGYAFDESFIPDGNVDILVYDSDRHLWSAGVEYQKTDPETGRG
ncbi:MAG: outer membrane protein transport protein, partial [Pseudomonadota bacterium]